MDPLSPFNHKKYSSFIIMTLQYTNKLAFYTEGKVPI